VITVAGGGASGTQVGSNNGIGSNALFNFPQSVSVDTFGTVYVTDTLNNVIRKIFTCPSGFQCVRHSEDVSINPCPAGYFCTYLMDQILCPTGFYCPTGASAALPCPLNTTTLFVGATSLTSCTTDTRGSSASSAASSPIAGSSCSSDSSCASSSCRGGYCCSVESAALGCSSCASLAGTCVLFSPGQLCASSFDCGTNLCLGGCCCASSALLSAGCTACRCLSLNGTTATTAGTCTRDSSPRTNQSALPSCNSSSASINASSVSLSSAIMFPSSTNVTDAMPLVFLPSSSPLNRFGVDIIVASAQACAAFAANTAGASTCSSTSYSLSNGVYFYLGRAADLGMAPGGACSE
jgi:hypothetical protein